LKILILSRYGPLGPSSRVRFYQYLPHLKSNHIDYTVVPLLGDKYLKDLYSGRRNNWKDIVKSYVKRITCLLKWRNFDLLWVEYEILPWLPAFIEVLLSWNRVPYVVDYDDALFHRYDMHPNPVVRAILGKKIDVVMRRATLVIVGNGYLGDRAWKAGAKRVEYVPTVVDLRRYPLTPHSSGPIFTVGWIGSPLTAKYLGMIKEALREICSEAGTRLVLVGSGEIDLEGVPAEIRPWSEESEAADIQSFDVGVMPLPDDPWTRGKCGYKVVQYMACGKPVVASPVGVNHKMVENGINGFLAETTSEWVDAIKAFRDSRELRDRMGREGRSKVENGFCLQVTASRLLSLLRSAVD